MKSRLFTYYVVGIIVLLSHLPFTVFGEESSHRTAAKNLLEAMNLDTMLSDTVDKVLEFQLTQNPALIPYKNTMKKFFDKYLGRAGMEDDYIQLYMDEFSQKELEEITIFYKSPTGKKALEKIPEVIARGAAIGQENVQANINELEEMIAAEAQRIQSQQKNAEK